MSTELALRIEESEVLNVDNVENPFEPGFVNEHIHWFHEDWESEWEENFKVKGNRHVWGISNIMDYLIIIINGTKIVL